MTVFGTSNVLTMPVEVNTKVIEVKHVLCQRLGVDPDDLQFIVRQSSSVKKCLNTEEVPRSIIVKGIRGWERERAKYPHPICIVGAGHSGLRQGLSFQKEKILDYTIFDKCRRVGGVAWNDNANPTSKLQSELGVYHLQYDPDYACPRATMKTWPTSGELLDHFQETAREYGILAHCQLGTEITEVKLVVEQKDAPWHKPAKQCYEIVAGRVGDKTGDEVMTTFSAIAAYPGTLTTPLRMDYKGEDVFDGSIGYGMFSEFDYTEVRGNTCAIVGFGAFAVENVRTCLEHGASKTWMICRRKNIAMPRVISWWCNQSVFPPPGAMMFEFMKPMYDLIPDDPWTYYAVVSNKDRTTCTVRQKARFGIGDVYFLACHYKRNEVVVDMIKRLKPSQILLESGDKLEAHHLIKVLGFKPNESVDKVFGVKEMVGFFANGDWRRWICSEFPGVDAGKFGGTSFSPGAIINSGMYSWVLNYPKDVGPALDANVLPKQKANKDQEKPAYVWDARTGSMVVMVLTGGIIPGLAEWCGALGPLNRTRQHEVHPLEQFVDECAAEWRGYEELFRGPGDDRPRVPYPYTHEFVRAFCERNDKEGQAEIDRQMARMTS